ncbi:DUF4263 domain-containing protein [Microbacterium hydrocarbonoxydans]|nr:DUF4263 domain-containing protein [Microbacterium hydrocarbonoxydans]
MTDVFDDDSFFFLDESELSDRRGRIEQQVVNREVVLTRIPEQAGRDTHEVVRFDLDTRLLRIFPKSYRSGDLVPQFRYVTEIQVEDSEWDPSSHSQEHTQYNLLAAKGLPRGFNTIYDFGLGIGKQFRSFVDSLEEHTTRSILRFVGDGDEGLDEDGLTLRVKFSRFSEYRAAVDLYRDRGWTVVRRVIEAETHNAIAPLFDLPEAEPIRGRHPMVKLLTEEVATGHVMNVTDRELLADAVTNAAPVLAGEAPERLVKLRDDIELVSLDALISQFERDLSGRFASNEGHWQGFFNRNRFALQLLFAAPVSVEWQQAHVRSSDATGSGARIADFLCANVVTKTVLLVEIKTPGATLMAAQAYRGQGTEAAVHVPHKELAGAVAQVQSQMSSISQHFPQMIPSTSTVDPWNQPQGAVIVGRVSTLTSEQRESFLRYRDGLADVTVLAYDEVLERLKGLREMLGASPGSP